MVGCVACALGVAQGWWIAPLRGCDRGGSESQESLGLTGSEVYEIRGIADGLKPHKELTVRARRDDGSEVVFQTIARVDSPVEVEYYHNGGILQTVLRGMVGSR
jgi:aconitate hydratase